MILGRILCIFGIHADPVEKIYSFQSFWFCSRCGKMVQRRVKKKDEAMF